MSGMMPPEEEPYEPDSEVRAPGLPLGRVVLVAGLVALVGFVSAVQPGGPRELLARVRGREDGVVGRWAEAQAWAVEVGAALRDQAAAWKAGVEAGVAGLMEQLPELPGAGADGPAREAGRPAPGGSTPGGSAPDAPAPDAPAPSAPEAILPVRGKLLYDYGWLPQGQEPHGGLDFAAAVGDPVLAIADGTVLRVAEDPALGGFVEVDHGFLIALYGQVADSQVKAGERVTQGRALAAIAEPTGKEGDREAHLHLEVRVTPGAKPVDPAPFLPLSAAPQGGEAD